MQSTIFGLQKSHSSIIAHVQIEANEEILKLFSCEVLVIHSVSFSYSFGLSSCMLIFGVFFFIREISFWLYSDILHKYTKNIVSHNTKL